MNDPEPRLTRAEYWLLANVVDHTCPISFLDGYDPGEMFNNASHGLPRARLVEVLGDLFARGWVRASRGNGDVPGGTLTTQQVAAAIDEPPPAEDESCLYYGLTDAGGAVWEAFAVPRWDRYIDTKLGHPDGEFVGATEWRVRKYFSLVRFRECAVMPESVRWDEVRPWPATYWKTLPVGYRVRFDWDWAETPPHVENVHDLFGLQKWFAWE